MRIFREGHLFCFDNLASSLYNRYDRRDSADMLAGVTLGPGRIKLIS